MTRMKKFGDLVKEDNRLISVMDDVEYRCGGVRLHGKGMFIREYKTGMEIRKKFVQHVVNEGDIVYSTIFAKSGAFAVADAGVAGAVLSEKFPTFRLVDSSLSLDYLRWFFRSGQLARIAEEQVTGIAAFSLSHLSKSKFLKLLIPVPSPDRQAEVVRLCEEISKNAIATSVPLESNIALTRHLLAASAEKLFADFPRKSLAEIGSYASRPAEIISDRQYMQVTVAMIRIRGQRPPPTACRSPWPHRDARHNPASKGPGHVPLVVQSRPAALREPAACFGILLRSRAQD
jgi:type I restriction enzyme, S subunit